MECSFSVQTKKPVTVACALFKFTCHTFTLIWQVLIFLPLGGEVGSLFVSRARRSLNRVDCPHWETVEETLVLVEV